MFESLPLKIGILHQLPGYFSGIAYWWILANTAHLFFVLPNGLHHVTIQYLVPTMPTFPPPVRTQRNAVPEELPCTVQIYAVTYRSKQFEASSPQAKMDRLKSDYILVGNLYTKL